MGDLLDGAAVFHVGGVTACAEDAADFHGGVRVGGGDESSCCVVDEGGEGDWEVLFEVSPSGSEHGKSVAYSFLDGGLELRNNVVAFDTRNVEAFGPSLEDAVIDEVLSGRV